MAPGGDDDDDCNYAFPKVRDFPGWALTDRGCGGAPCFSRYWAIIPWSALRRLARWARASGTDERFDDRIIV
jgi:hypothetical protein